MSRSGEFWGRRLVAVGAVMAMAMIVLPGSIGATAAQPGPPEQLTVDGLPSPVGIDDAPSFAWQGRDTVRGAEQNAYRIVVRHAGATVWDSGRVASADQAFVTYRGPALASDTRYQWTVQTWSNGRVSPFASMQSFDTGVHDGDWRAQWIRRLTTDPVDAADEYTYARRELRVGASPIVRAVAYVSADQQFQLFVDGARAGAGEAFSYPDSQYYQAIDVSGQLRPGTVNAVGALYHWYGVGKGRPAGSPGLIAQLVVDHADGSRDQLVTDASWKVLRGPWLPSTGRNQEMDPVDETEHIDGTREPVGWSTPGFDDRLWSPATALGRHPVAPWIHLISERTRIVEQPIHPVSVTPLPGGSYVADFGQVIAAAPTVTFRSGVPGRVVSMRAGYLLDQGPPVPGQVSTSRGTQHTDMSYAYVERLGEQTFHPYDYLGFRYFQIDNAGEPIDVDHVVAEARHAAVPDEQAAMLSTSDPMIDNVFALARHSALFTSQEQFIDTPTREKGPFLRDGFNISETSMRAFGEQNLSRRALLEFAQSQARYWPDGRLNAIYPSGQPPGKRDIPDFTEIYPEWVWQYELATGDRALAAEVYPVMAAIADYVARAIDPHTGLVTNLPGGDGDYLYGIVDWPKNMRYGYDLSTVARTTVNILAADVFGRVGQIADLISRPTAESQRQRQRRDALVAAINHRLRRADGVYVDGLRADGAPSPHASQHANAYAIAYGVVPDRLDVVADQVVSLGMAMGPQTSQLLLDALHDSGRDANLVRVVTDRVHDGWGNVLAQGGTFTWETWRPDDANGDSMSHGWGSTVLVALQESVLGVRPTALGFAAFEVVPPTGGVTSAVGRVPTPRGSVTVSWSRPATASGSFALDVTVPANALATVAVPATSLAAVSEGGRPVTRVEGVHVVGMQGELAVLSVGAGTYQFRSASVPSGYVGSATARPARLRLSPGLAPARVPTLVGASSGPASVSPPAAVGGIRRSTRRGTSLPWWIVLVGVLALVVTTAGLVRRLATRATPR